jgi:Tfp pilus assembly protein PilF
LYWFSNNFIRLTFFHFFLNSHFPENAELCTSLGLLYLQTGAHAEAFEQLGTAMAFEPNNSKAVLAAGSVAQVSF